jgi:hypothetical protein
MAANSHNIDRRVTTDHVEGCPGMPLAKLFEGS